MSFKSFGTGHGRERPVSCVRQGHMMNQVCLAAVFFLAFALLSATQLFAEIAWNQGSVAHRKLPPPAISETYVRLDVPHIRQGENLCVPTSAAMVLQYFGDPADPRKLKAMAEGHKPVSQRNRDFTYFRDLDVALRQMGYKWKIRSFPKTNSGFSSGMRQIKRHLSSGRPVLIDVHQDNGHTFVLMGFDESRQIVYVRDPNLPRSSSRVLSYSQLRESWHDHQFGDGRTAVFTFSK